MFDLLTLRSIRGDALLRYNSLNQSEPLRINLYGLLALSLFAFPTVSEAVNGDSLNQVQTVASIVAGIGSTGLFVRECGKRSRQLLRMERELNADSLKLRLPTNAFSDNPYTPPATLGEVFQTSSPPRIIAICGPGEELTRILNSIRIYGRRLKQASTFVVPVATDAATSLSSFSVEQWKRNVYNTGGTTERSTWLAVPDEEGSWIAYFDELAAPTSSESDETDAVGTDKSSNSLRWFGLNSGGRSFASAAGEEPQWLQLMGQFLRPTVLLDETDGNLIKLEEGSEAASVLQAQTDFYNALRTGDSDAMKAVLSDEKAFEVSAVIDAGGRIDDWSMCLADGARPEGMQLSGRDALLVSETEAYSSIIEFPANLGADVNGSLLAIQKWTKQNGQWKLGLHQTIPWSADRPALGTLLCDCRGCSALTRSNDNTRTRGGIIG